MAQVLEGVRIIDFTTAIAGSFAIRLLADLGADVIKVESFEGDSFRSQIGNFIVWNMGKRGIVVDLRKKEGRKIISRLVEGADVVAHNYRPATAKKLGVDYETLKAINPSLIYSSESAWGDTGPYGGKPGFDPVLQAESGIMASQGYGQETPMDLSHAEVDVPTTELHTFSILAALYVRERTGKGQHVKTSLMNGAISIQADTFIFYDGRPEQASAGPGYLGPRATDRFYKTQDNWIYIECNSDEFWDNLCKAVGKLDLRTDDRFNTASAREQNNKVLVSVLESIFTTKSSSEWIAILEKEKVPCSPVNRYEDVPEQDHIIQRDLLGESYQPIMQGNLKTLKTAFTLSEAPSTIERPAPLLGEHTEEILRELAYSSNEIQELRKLHVIL